MTVATTGGGGQEVARTEAAEQAEHPLVQWAYAAQQANNIAKSLARTSFVPDSLRNKPDDITAAILAGTELGLQPMAALRSMDVIKGTPALRAHAMRGLVQSAGHQVQLVESDEQQCVIRGRRQGEGEGDWQTVTWTIERALKLGLTGKDQWKKQPQAMLVARATGEICRLIASDVLHAMPYASEELDGNGQADGAQVPRVTVRELAPDAPDPREEPQQGEARTELSEDDPWYVRPEPADRFHGTDDDFDEESWPEPAAPGSAS